MIYLDNNATTQPTPAVVEAVTGALNDHWHNPSSIHRPGQAARAQVELSRGKFAQLLGVRPRELSFTSGGTESIDLAIRGLIGAFLGSPQRSKPGPAPLLITSAIEHSAVRDLAAELERRGEATVAYVEVNLDGTVDPDSLAALLQTNRAQAPARAAIVSLQWANNETGAVQPIEAFHQICRDQGALLHCDAVQWIGKCPAHTPALLMPLTVTHRHREDHSPTAVLPCDLLTCSAHKFHGPKGVGLLWARAGVRLRPTLLGTQELGRRAGTENVPGIIGAGVAAMEAAAWIADASAISRQAALRTRFENAVLAACPASHINGPTDERRLWNTTNIAFPSLEAEAVLLGLSEAGVCASAGAACSSGSLDPSPVLLAMGVTTASAHGSIRFSLSRSTTPEEVDAAVPIIAKVVARLRRVMPVGS